jgi:hypothetical protein
MEAAKKKFGGVPGVGALEGRLIPKWFRDVQQELGVGDAEYIAEAQAISKEIKFLARQTASADNRGVMTDRDWNNYRETLPDTTNSEAEALAGLYRALERQQTAVDVNVTDPWAKQYLLEQGGFTGGNWSARGEETYSGR